MLTLSLLLLACGPSVPSSPPGDVVPGVEAYHGTRIYRPLGEPQGAIVVLHGSEGGSQPYAPLLAKRFAQEGLVAASFCWFDCGADTPAAIDRVSLDRTEDFVAWFASGPATGKPVVLYGASRGAEHALLIASLNGDSALIAGVASHAGSDTVVAAYNPRTGLPVPADDGYEAAWTWHGEPLYGERALPYGSGPPIGIERYPGPVFLSHGESDPLWPAARSHRLQAARDAAGLQTESHYWPGEGHILQPAAAEELVQAIVAFSKRVASP